jgi:hypothetical protein
MVDVTATRAGLDGALDFANELFNALEFARHSVIVTAPDASFSRERIDDKERPPKKDRRQRPHLRWHFVASLANSCLLRLYCLWIGSVIEMIEPVQMRYVDGKYIRKSEYVQSKFNQYHDYIWTTTRNLPAGRLCLVVYASYRNLYWSMSFQVLTLDRYLDFAIFIN